MKRTALSDHPCSIAHALDVAGEWWTPLILRDIAYGIRRFVELQADLGISANVLADRLETLVANGILETHIYQQRPKRSEYYLTEKGTDLIPALLALMRWGDRWTWGNAGGPVSVSHQDCGREVTVEIRCPHCERSTAPAELRAKLAEHVTHAPADGDPGYVSAQRLGVAEGGVELARVRKATA